MSSWFGSILTADDECECGDNRCWWPRTDEAGDVVVVVEGVLVLASLEWNWKGTDAGPLALKIGVV